jgi:hypothetical protein
MAGVPLFYDVFTIIINLYKENADERWMGR